MHLVANPLRFEERGRSATGEKSQLSGGSKMLRLTRPGRFVMEFLVSDPCASDSTLVVV